MKRTSSMLAAAAIAGGLAFAAPAHAGTAWSISIGGPGYAVAAGPAYYYGPYRHWHRAYVPAPVYAAPVVLAPPVVYRAPVVYAPRVVYAAPRVVYPAPVVVRPW